MSGGEMAARTLRTYPMGGCVNQIVRGCRHARQKLFIYACRTYVVHASPIKEYLTHMPATNCGACPAQPSQQELPFILAYVVIPLKQTTRRGTSRPTISTSAAVHLCDLTSVERVMLNGAASRSMR